MGNYIVTMECTYAFDVELLPGCSRICTSLRIGYDF